MEMTVRRPDVPSMHSSELLINLQKRQPTCGLEVHNKPIECVYLSYSRLAAMFLTLYQEDLQTGPRQTDKRLIRLADR